MTTSTSGQLEAEFGRTNLDAVSGREYSRLEHFRAIEASAVRRPGVEEDEVVSSALDLGVFPAGLLVVDDDETIGPSSDRRDAPIEWDLPSLHREHRATRQDAPRAHGWRSRSPAGQ